jgi:DNA-binding HxlR family transcriptional regulator
MRLTSLANWNCSIARTLDVVGEWWTLLILRDAFRGTQKLTDNGILERHAYSQHPPRYEYHLTGKGQALFPVIVALLRWGDDWAPAPDGPPVVLVHDSCGNVTQPMLTCPHCHGEVCAANTRSQPGPGRRPFADAPWGRWTLPV